MPVNWTNDFSVHVTTIDDDHRDLIEIINDLDAAVAEGCHAVFIGRFLGRLADYAARHFLREEQIMRDYGYPDYVDHVLAHEQLIYRLGELIFEFETGAKGVTAHTIDLLRDWFCGHICVDDREFGRYLRDHLDANPRSLADGLARSPSSAVAA